MDGIDGQLWLQVPWPWAQWEQILGSRILILGWWDEAILNLGLWNEDPPFPPSSLIFSCTVEFQCVQSKRDSDILIIGVFNNGTFSMDDYCFIMQVSQSLYGSLSVYIFFTFIIQAHAA